MPVVITLIWRKIPVTSEYMIVTRAVSLQFSDYSLLSYNAIIIVNISALIPFQVVLIVNDLIRYFASKCFNGSLIITIRLYLYMLFSKV